MKISDSIKYVGVNDHEIDLFEGQFEVPMGMAYNSYVILDDKIAVMDSVDQKFGEEWLKNIENVLAGKNPEYSKKKLAKAYEILKMISENPNISIDELRIALDVTDRTVARYISELKDKGIIERKGPDNGGEWKIK